jgi:hypothetical protein
MLLAAARFSLAVCALTSEGSEAYPIPVPAPMIEDPTMISHSDPVTTIRITSPTAMITPDTVSTRAALQIWISRAVTGASTSMSTPLGSRHNPATSTEEPKP